MKILVACEESQEVCKAFRAKGYEAYSCDILDCSGGHPEWHLHGDVRKYIFDDWDLMIAHPPCTYLSNSGVRWLKNNPLRYEQMVDGAEFFKMMLGFDHIPKICVENPIPHKHAKLPKYTQLIQPWHFGHQKMKATCLWLKGLPPLVPTDIVGPPPADKKERYRWQDVWTASPGPERKRLRSKTYSGVATAMAEQWTKII